MSVRLDRPIILLCSERSGSNLITRLFDAHPAVAAPGAAHLLRVMVPLSSRYTGCAAGMRADMLALYDAKIPAWRLDDLDHAARTALLAGLSNAADMAMALYDAERRAATRDFVFIKENQAFAFIDDIIRTTYAPRFLHMVRDPRDMALSWARAPVLRGGVVRAAHLWRDDQAGFLELAAAHHIVSLRYEDLIAAPEATLRRVCAELALPYSADMHAHSPRTMEDASRTSLLANLSRPILADNAGQFLDGLTPTECAYIEAGCAPLMAHFGYSPTQPPANAAELEQTLRAAEPMTKPGYATLPATERARYENWSALVARLRAA